MITYKHQLTFKSLITTSILMLILFSTSCDSHYRPRTVPDTVPPIITVKITGAVSSPTYTIRDMTITPAPPAITSTYIPGTTYHAVVTATDTIGLYNLRVGLYKDCFEFSDIRATPGVITTSDMGDYTVIDVDLPISPAKTGTLLTFSFRAKPMSQGTFAPFLGMTVISTDFGEAGRSSNVSSFVIPMVYSSE